MLIKIALNDRKRHKQQTIVTEEKKQTKIKIKNVHRCQFQKKSLLKKLKLSP